MMDVDRPSFQLGMINCFAEMVAAGVKRLAISPPLLPGEYQEIRDGIDAIVEGSGILSFVETSLLVTDLQPPAFTEGKWSVLFYADPEVFDTYQGLKETKEALEAAGGYTLDARREISREFMRLLSYPEETIVERLRAGGEEDPFMLVGKD